MVRRVEHKELLQLLVKVVNRPVTDYYYFPEIVYAGRQKIERSELDFLLAEALVILKHFDSFGRYYQLSQKGESLLKHCQARVCRKRPTTASLRQGCFYFSRPKAGGARSLVFL